MPWPAVLAAGVAGAASLIGGAKANRDSRAEAERARKFAGGEAEKGRAFSERMSNTSWQRGLEDMKAAGVNPALAFSQGGASSPVGGQAGSSMATQDDMVTPAVSSAQGARMMRKQMRNMDSENDRTYQQSRYLMAQTQDAGAAAELKRRQQRLVTSQRQAVNVTNQLSRLSVFSARNAANMEQSKLGAFAPYIERIMRMTLGSGAAGPIAGALVGRGMRGAPQAQPTYKLGAGGRPRRR